MSVSVTVEKLARFRGRAMASFVVDDFTAVTADETRDYGVFGDWAQEAGVKGECSVIQGMRRTEEGRAIALDAGLGAALERHRTHIDNYMEVMTHGFLYDFAADRIRGGGPREGAAMQDPGGFSLGRSGGDGPHEGVWLLDRTRPVEEYRDYFRAIIKRGMEQGVRYSGLTLPGCGCQACGKFYQGNHLAAQAGEFNAAVFEALLGLAEEGLMAGPLCGLFVGSTAEGPADVRVMAERDGAGVYDLPPGVAADFMGRWDQNREFLDGDKYLTADGQRGRLAQLLAQGTRTLILYGHWQSLRPGRMGFPVLQEVARRLAQHHAEKIVWMKPTEIMAYRHTERHTELRAATDGRSFTLAIPFAPLHAVTIRVMGWEAALQTPAGRVLEADEDGPAGAIFSIVPEKGRYEVVLR